LEAEGRDLPARFSEVGKLTQWALAHRYEGAAAPGADRQQMLALTSDAVTWARGVVELAGS